MSLNLQRETLRDFQLRLAFLREATPLNGEPRAASRIALPCFFSAKRNEFRST